MLTKVVDFFQKAPSTWGASREDQEGGEPEVGKGSIYSIFLNALHVLKI